MALKCSVSEVHAIIQSVRTSVTIVWMMPRLQKNQVNWACRALGELAG